jgi:hypothetical protein
MLGKSGRRHLRLFCEFDNGEDLAFKIFSLVALARWARFLTIYLSSTDYKYLLYITRSTWVIISSRGKQNSQNLRQICQAWENRTKSKSRGVNHRFTVHNTWHWQLRPIFEQHPSATVVVLTILLVNIPLGPVLAKKDVSHQPLHCTIPVCLNGKRLTFCHGTSRL